MARLRRLHLPGRSYFLTCSTWHRRPFFARERAKRTLLETMAQYRKEGLFRLHGFIVLPDHVHLVLTPLAGRQVSQIMHALKIAVSKRLKAQMRVTPPVWQRRFFDHVIRGSRDYVEIMRYIHGNAVKHELSETPRGYAWSSWHNYHQPEEARIEIDPLLA